MNTWHLLMFTYICLTFSPMLNGRSESQIPCGPIALIRQRRNEKECQVNSGKFVNTLSLVLFTIGTIVSKHFPKKALRNYQQ